MKVSVQENPVRPGTKRLVVHTGPRAAYAEFLAWAASSSTVTRADLAAVAELQREWLLNCAREGRCSDLGPLGHGRLSLRGSFAASPERLDESNLEINLTWVLPPALKREAARLARAGLAGRTEPRPQRPNPTQARRIGADAALDPVANRYGPGQPLRVYGSHLDYEGTNAEEGVYLLSPSGEALRPGVVIERLPKTILFLMPPAATGAYRLEVRRRWPRGHGPLLSGALAPPLRPCEEA